MLAGEICNRDVVFVRRDETIIDAAKLMRKYHVGSVVAVDEQDGRRVPAGVLTDRDIVVEVIAGDVDPGVVRVGDVMRPELVTVRESDHVADVLDLMQQKGVRRVPVVNDDGELEGILALDDLLELFAGQFADVRALLDRELKKEQARHDPSPGGTSTIQ
ncbi:MAG: putative signal transduction protein [Gammaproteobacteria bacterium]|nr:MAG: putative signal transduction protein [Gammaproteobacteria bacterium]TND05756.1 MAG: putative signal transduction protein with CBS domain [Gammaproteobacteria bacterium]